MLIILNGSISRFSLLQQRANWRRITSVLSFGRACGVGLGSFCGFINSQTDETPALLFSGEIFCRCHSLGGVGVFENHGAG